MSESLPDKRQTLRDINASDAFRNTLLPRRDAVTDGGYPLWHGWAIMDAFLAGADYARSHEPQNAAPQMPGSCVSTGAEARVQSPVVVHGEPLLQKTPTATSADAASASSTTPRSDETPSRVVWVIEKGSPAQYFAGFNYGAGKWTPDFARALHAADREQAQSLWDCDRSVFAIFNDDCRIADHIICGGPAFTPSATRQSQIDAEHAAMYRYLRSEGLLDGHVVAHEAKHGLDESDIATHDYLERCDAAMNEMRAADGGKQT